MNSRRIQNVLIHRLGSLGDTLVALPAFRLVREAFPDAIITVLTNHAQSDHAKSVGMAAILDGTGLIDDYLYYPVRLRRIDELNRLRNQIARRRFDVVAYLSSPGSTHMKVSRDALFFISCGIRRQYGFPWTQRGRLNSRLTGTRLYQSESDRLVSNLQSLGRVNLADERWWNLCLSADEQRLASRHLAGTIDDYPFLALSVGTKAEVNDWTQPNWLAAVEALNDLYPAMGLVTFGSAHEFDRSESLLNIWSGPRLNLCGKTSPRVSAAILARADCFVGHDSGPMHLAANGGTPCVVVFSARVHPGVWFPRGSGHQVIYHETECGHCQLFECAIHNKKCILSITCHEVVEAVQKVMAADRRRRPSLSYSSS
jgi:heptosyltransferase III